MKPSAIKSVFIFTILIILGSSVYLGLRATAPNSRIEQEPSMTEPSYPMIERLFIPSRKSAITLEEARAMAKFEFLVPTYLPEGMSLTRVEVDEILPIDRFYLYFSDSPANVAKISLEIDYSFERPPTDEELERMASRYIRVPLSIENNYEVIIEGLIENTYTVSIENNYKIIRENLHRVVSFKGIKGIGRELGYTNKLQGPLPAYLLWWKDGLRFEMESFAYPLNELIKIAESMIVQRSSDKTFKKIAPTADAHVAEGYPNKYRGDATALYLQSWTENYKNERIFLKFDLNDIPAGSRIEQARLHLYCWRGRYGSTNAQALSVNDDTWDESTITWNNQPSVGKVLDVALLDNLTAENRWHSWDVTSFVKKEYTSDMVVSLCLKAAMENDSGQYAFESKEWFDATLHPYLEVAYTPPPHAMSVSISRQDEDDANLPGSLMSYLVRVTNEGGLEDTYTLGMKDTADWASSIFPGSLTIPPGESRMALMQVKVPQNALLGGRDEITLAVTSEAASAIGDSSTYVLRTEAVGRVTKNITPTADAHVAQGYPENNFGSAALYLQSYTEGYKNERIFLKFDLSQIPTNSKIIQAKIYLYCWRGKYGSINAQALSVDDDTWDEGTITWNNQPSQGELLDTVYLENLLAGGEWYTWDATSFVARELKDDRVASFCIKAAVEDMDGQYAFESKEWWNTTLCPRLEIVYTL